MNQEILQIKPVNSQVRYRATLVPPNYNVVTTDVAAALAGELAEAFKLTSRDILFNQGTLSTSYLAFRYFVSVRSANISQFSYLDVSIGADQVEILFVNPLSASVVKEEFLKVWKPLIDKIKPRITKHYFEISLDSSTEGASANKFLDQFVAIQFEVAPKLIGKGVSLTVEYPESGAQARISLENSNSIPEGLFMFITYTLQRIVTDMVSLGDVIESAIEVYRSLQPVVHIRVMEEV